MGDLLLFPTPNVVRSRGRKRVMQSRYVHPDLGDDPQADKYQAADMDLCKRCSEFIAAHYISHHFVVDVSTARGYMKVYIPELMGSANGWIIHIKNIQNGFDFDRLMHRACGEILERFNIPRSGLDEAAMREALSKVPIVGLQNSTVPG